MEKAGAGGCSNTEGHCDWCLTVRGEFIN